MKSTVYFIDLRAKYKDNFVGKLGKLLETVGLADVIKKRDLVNQERALPGSCLKKNRGPGKDKFQGVYPDVDWNHQFEYAEEIGLGSRDYILNQC